MRVTRWLVAWFLRLWPFRGGLVYPTRDDRIVYRDEDGRPRRKLLYIPSDDELVQQVFVRQLARDMAEQGLSRRKLIDWVADEIYGFNGHFVTADGKVIDLEEVDDVFGEPSFKWVSDFVKWDVRVPAQAIQRKIIPRIRYLAMAREAARDRGADSPVPAGL